MEEKNASLIDGRDKGFGLIEERKINAFITHTTNILANHHFYLSHNHNLVH